VSDREIRIILDTSAIHAYVKGSIDVGEVISEIADEGACAGLPVPCVVEAGQLIVEDHQLHLYSQP
jgi:hypothetical protein